MFVFANNYRNISNRFGFTLMEIMVVIIVIAVLASVGGSMVTSFVEQSKVSATKQKLSNLKKALLAYQADVGRMPHSGPSKSSGCIEAYFNATNKGEILSYNDDDKNVLLTDSVNVGLKMKQYKKRWQGPYIDSSASDFMFDAWDNPIHYVAKGRNLYLWSYGIDGNHDDTDPEKLFKRIQNEDDYVDDIMVSVKRFKKKLN